MLLLALILGCRTDEPPPCIETAAVCDNGSTFELCRDRDVPHWLFDDGTRFNCDDDGDCNGAALVDAMAYCGVETVIIDNPPDDGECTEPDGWFVDEDGDGWGVGEPSYSCENLEPLVRNNRDCGDEDASVTGRTGSACPAEMNADEATVVALILGDKEFIAFGGDTGLKTANTAQDVCGTWAPANEAEFAHLANFNDAEEYRQVRDGLVEPVRREANWAGWLGIGPGPIDDWVWQFGGSLNMGDIGTCELGAADPMQDSALALVWIAGQVDPCLGTPEPLLGSYTRTQAHFICERPVPDPANYMWFE